MAKNGVKMIDAEMHVMEPVDLWNRYIDPEFKARAPRRLNERRWDIRTMVEGEVMAAMPGGDWPALTDVEEKTLGDRYAEEIARDFDPESQVRAMDKEGLDLAILFPTSAMYITAFETMDARFADAAGRATNHWLHDHLAAAAHRFKQLGIVHIASPSVEQMLACMDIIMGGVMERFPRLRFAFLEAQCGWLPFWLHRMDEHHEWREPYGEMTHLTMPPSEYFRRQGYCAVECDEEFVKHVVEAFGDDNLVTTTDYPHGDSKYPKAMDRFLTLPLSDKSKKKILWDNVLKLYAL